MVSFLLLFCLLFFIFSPQRYWSWSLLKFQSFQKRQVKGAGEQLLDWLSNNGAGNGHLPEYKNFSGLAKLLFDLRRQVGAPTGEALKSLRRGLSQDLALERQLARLKRQAGLEGLGIACISFCLLSALETIGGIVVSSQAKMLFLAAIGAGLLIIQQSSRALINRVMRPYHFFIERLLAMGAASHANIPIKQALELAPDFRGTSNESWPPVLLILSDRLNEGLTRWSRFGEKIQDLLAELSEEALLLQKERATDLSRQLSGLIFIVSIVFFLGPYLATLLFALLKTL
jgi:hypothetical protein